VAHRFTKAGPGAVVLLLLALALGCSAADNKKSSGSDSDADSDSDSDTDTDSDTDSDSDSDTGSDTDTDSDPYYINSHAWISNAAEHTVSKIETSEAVEVARYDVSADWGASAESVSVNLHGDVVVVSHWHDTGTVALVKIAGAFEDCVDADETDGVETSTGPDDVLPWGEDECVLWHTTLDPLPQTTVGSQGIAWDGSENPESGEGGVVWFATCRYVDASPEWLYEIDGDSGDVIERHDLPDGFDCVYGAAVDADGRLWLTNGFSQLAEVDTSTLDIEIHTIACGHGLTVAPDGRVWTAGVGNCVHRFDPETDTGVQATLDYPEFTFVNAVSAGREITGGYMWVADTIGAVVQIDPETMEVVGTHDVGEQSMWGAYPDIEGRLWSVTNMNNTAYRFDYSTDEVVEIEVGHWPYAYSDITGAQLYSVVIE
jgi:streptogramin lyase